MRVIIICLFIGAATHADPVAEVLLELHHDRAKAFAHAEQFYNEVADAQISGRLATLLAFAPAAEVHTEPYMYARFAFARDQSLTPALRLKLAKLAGEGLFEHAQFAQAQKMFTQALALGSLNEEEREYLQYQIAWCELNQKAATSRGRHFGGLVARMQTVPPAKGNDFGLGQSISRNRTFGATDRRRRAPRFANGRRSLGLRRGID